MEDALHESWDEAPERGPGTATGQNPASLTDIEVGLHKTYDRVVFEFSGDVRPGYQISYGTLDAPGSGKTVDIAGRYSLEVIFHHAVRQDKDDYEGQPTLPPVALPRVAQVKYLGGFEGTTHAGIGISGDSPPPFRVFTLENPSRIVIDIAHPTSS